MQLLAIDIANFPQYPPTLRAFMRTLERSDRQEQCRQVEHPVGDPCLLFLFSIVRCRSIGSPIREQIDFFNKDVSEPVTFTFRFCFDDSDRERLLASIISETPQVKHLVEALPAGLDLAITLAFNPSLTPFAVLRSVELTDGQSQTRALFQVSEAAAAELFRRASHVDKLRKSDEEAVSQMGAHDLLA